MQTGNGAVAAVYCGCVPTGRRAWDVQELCELVHAKHETNVRRQFRHGNGYLPTFGRLYRSAPSPNVNFVRRQN